MKKLMRILSAVCIATLLITSFTGCGQEAVKPVETSNSAKPEPSVKEPEPAKPITMRFSWWGSDIRHQATLDAIAAYKQKNPHVTIEGEYSGYDGYQQKLMTQLAGGSAPDLIQIDPIWNAQLGAQKENFVDLGAEATIDIKQFEDKVIKGFCTVEGMVIGLPMGINGFGLQMNKAFMEKFNIPLDTVWTYEKIIEVGKKVHEQDKEAYLMIEDPTGLQVKFMADYSRSKTGKYWINDDFVVTISKEDLTHQFSVMKEMFDSGALLPLGESALYNNKVEQHPKFISGQIGMTQDWSGTLAKYKAVIKPENFVVGKAIVADGGVDTSTTYKPSMLLAVNKKSANAAEAVKFTQWMLNDKEAALILKDCRSIPGSQASRQALIDGNVLDKDIMTMVENTLKNPAAPVPLVMNNSEIAEITKDVCQKVVFAKVTPEQGADELIKRVTEKLNALKAEKK